MPARLSHLDGLRGWAALVVVLFHSTWEMFGTYVPSIRVNALGVLTDGHLAVYAFFVLSGLALSQAYLRSGDDQGLLKMALARYPRLAIPIVFAALIGFVLMRCGLLYNQAAVPLLGRADWLGIFYTFHPSTLGWLKFSLHDVFFDYDVHRSYDVFLWTMPIELTGSFVLFGSLALFGRNAVIRRCSYAILFVVIWRHCPAYLAFLYGVVIAEVLTLDALAPFRESKTAGVIGAGLILIGCACSPLLHHDDQPRAASAIAFILVLGASLSGVVRRALQSRLSQWLGAVSFPLYLVHSAIMCSLGCALAIKLDAVGVRGPVLAAVTIVAVVLASLAAAQAFLPVEVFAKKAAGAFASKARSALLARPSRVLPDPLLRESEAAAPSEGLSSTLVAS